MSVAATIRMSVAEGYGKGKFRILIQRQNATACPRSGGPSRS